MRRKAVVLAGALLAAGASAAAHAERSWDADIGAYLTYDFGGRRPGHFGFGVEVRAMYEQQRFDCGRRGALYTGVAGRFSIFGWDQFRLLVAPQFGLSGNLGYPAAPALTSAIGAELGFGYRFKRDPGPFLQPGLEGSAANVLFLRVDHAFGPEGDTQGLAHAASMDLGLRQTPKGSHVPGGSSCD
ncbi:MAG TPA: hypothetical protein VGP07_20920 [Polyangia bacterium]